MTTSLRLRIFFPEAKCFRSAKSTYFLASPLSGIGCRLRNSKGEEQTVGKHRGLPSCKTLKRRVFIFYLFIIYYTRVKRKYTITPGTSILRGPKYRVRPSKNPQFKTSPRWRTFKVEQNFCLLNFIFTFHAFTCSFTSTVFRFWMQLCLYT